jgi:alpha-D-ribose 1-methylphosphonate 5-triphosphate synthase subunit PhnH
MSAVVDLTGIAVGFTEPVFESQSVFRAVLDAMSRPGRIVRIETGLAAPFPRFEAGAAIALTVLDFETPVYVDPVFATARLDNWLRFHCGCPIANEPAEAAFAFVGAQSMPPLAAFNRGDPKYPDRSTTVVILVDALSGGQEMTLEGPGIATCATVSPTGLPDDFWQQMTDNRAEFQLGVDVVLVADDGILGLPRSTRVSNKGEF